MAAIFSQILNMSMTGSVVILLVMLARLILKRSPKIFSYVLWSVVLFRLLCPVAFTAPISVLDVVEPEQKETSNNTSIVTYIPATVNTQADFIMVQPEEQQVQVESVTESEEQLLMTPMHAAALAWAAGMAGMMLYSVIQYLALRRRLVGSVQLKGNIYLADHIDTAFVVGLVQPRIYLPSGVPSKERYYILAHEQHHIRRFDHLIKLLAYLALCIHWFNPLVWLAFVLAGKDMEMSCDEAVIKRLGPDIRADYSASLLRLATHKKILSGMPLAFGEGDTKDRVLNMARWKKPAKWLAAICVILCLCVLVVCAFNPEEEKTIEELTRRTTDSPVGTGIDDLSFTYPAGLTSELREVENWSRTELRRILKGQLNRGQFDHFFIDNGIDFGGVVDFIVPEDREIHLEELKLPSAWMGLEYISTSSTYPYAEGEYTLIKDGKDYIQLYLYTYSGRGYFIWFYTEQGNPENKEAILNSVEMGGGSGGGKYKLECDTPVSLGLFNITIPKGYGYSHHETVILEITQKDFWGDLTLLGCVTARPNPSLPIDSEEDLKPWVEAIGIELADEGVSHSYEISNEGPYGDVQLVLESSEDSKFSMAENHYFYIAGDIVYDLYFDTLKMDPKTEETILKSIWIKDPVNMPAKDKWVTSLGKTPVTIGQLPDGYNYGFDGDQNIVFAWGDSAVGGVKSYPIPEGLYDPEDGIFHWLEEMGIPDYEDPNLVYLGGITSGDNGWAAEFADEPADGEKRTVHRRHTFKVVGDTLYDIWFDMLKISFDNASEICKAVSIPQPPEETESYMPTIPAADIDTDTQLVTYGSLKMLLPSSFAATESQGVVVLTKDSVAVGGIRSWNYPEFQPSDIIELKKQELGIPIGYMSSSSAYGDTEYEIFWDGNPEGLNEEHQFFIDEDVIYDVWYDQNLISDGMAERFLKTVAINAEPNPAFTPQEQEALAKCKSVLDTVQGGSHHIAWEKFRTSSAGTSGYRVEYYSHEDNWLHTTSFQTGDVGEIQYRMMVDGESIFGTNGFDRSNENSDEKSDVAQSFSYLGEPERPWLSSYQWDTATVAYVDTLHEDGLDIIMLRIDEPFYGYPEETESYNVDFIFDGSGSFLRVELTAIVFRNNEFWTANETEIIYSMDPEKISNQIQLKYDWFSQ